MPFTQGFLDWALFDEHYTTHVLTQREFGPVEPLAYLLMADAFCGGLLDPLTTIECLRSRGDRLRYNRITLEYGVLSVTGCIRTYYRPGVGRPLPSRFKDNEDYFQWNCGRY